MMLANPITNKYESNSRPTIDVGDPDIKVILLGDSAVGKSKLMERYLLDDYNPQQVGGGLLTREFGMNEPYNVLSY